MIRQRTLKHLIKATGVGVHSGQKVMLVLRPSSTQHRDCLYSHRFERTGHHSSTNGVRR